MMNKQTRSCANKQVKSPIVEHHGGMIHAPLTGGRASPEEEGQEEKKAIWSRAEKCVVEFYCVSQAPRRTSTYPSELKRHKTRCAKADCASAFFFFGVFSRHMHALLPPPPPPASPSYGVRSVLQLAAPLRRIHAPYHSKRVNTLKRRTRPKRRNGGARYSRGRVCTSASTCSVSQLLNTFKSAAGASYLLRTDRTSLSFFYFFASFFFPQSCRDIRSN